MQRIDLDGSITTSGAERFVATVSGAPEYVQGLQLDLQRVSEISLGAGPRIGNALSRFEDVGLEVVIPEMGNGDWADYVSKQWKLFTRSGLGLAIATHASKVRFGEWEVTPDFKRHYGTAVGVFQNSVTIGEVDSPSSINASDPNTFSFALTGFLPKVNVPSGAFPKEDFSPLVELCREAILNVRDHAFAGMPPDRKRVAYLSLRFYRSLWTPEDDNDPLAPYLRRLWKSKSEVLQKTSGFLEIVVNDDGLGVAGRHSQDTNIYWKPIQSEHQIVLDALRAGGSIKPVAMDAVIRGDPGYGFSVMAESLRKLQGFALLRTGRVLAVCDGTRTDPLSRAFSIVSGQMGRVNYLPGTLIQAVVPIRSPQSPLALS